MSFQSNKIYKYRDILTYFLKVSIVMLEFYHLGLARKTAKLVYQSSEVEEVAIQHRGK